MAKKLAFEDLIKTEFRWPRKGDNPFAQSDKWQKNAYLATDVRTRLALMTEGYKKAADLMAKHSISKDTDRDFLVFPIIFNYRQFIELSLKSLLFNYGRHVGIQENWKSHNLIILWSDFEKMSAEFGTNDADEADEFAKEIVAQFAKIDPGSYSYRYPMDIKGNPIPLTHELLDLENLADVMDGLSGYFTGCDGYWGNLVDSQPSSEF